VTNPTLRLFASIRSPRLQRFDCFVARCVTPAVVVALHLTTRQKYCVGEHELMNPGDATVSKDMHAISGIAITA
jgi:hypothetical protein